MSQLHGNSIIYGKGDSHNPQATFAAVNPANGEHLDPPYHEATSADIDAALTAAQSAFADYSHRPPEQIAAFLERIGKEIIEAGQALIDRAVAETGLPAARLVGERARTVGQLGLFAALVREGSWVEAVLDRPDPQRQPIPKPDLRRMLIPIGPVVVFAASNFPLAFSVAGGDTASALAAGNPVIVKAHPAHPGTSEIVAEAIRRAVEAIGMPPGVFALLHGTRTEVGMGLVRHPLTRAVGFTGSLTAGRALFDAAAARPHPIPVYAEMGSVNPLFVFPKAMETRHAQIAQGLVNSVCLGVGQFCTKPGIVVVARGASTDHFLVELQQLIGPTLPGTLLYRGILDRFDSGVRRLEKTASVRKLGGTSATADYTKTQAPPVLFTVNASDFLADESLAEELFGPASIVVVCDGREEMLAIAHQLEGQLTATVHGEPEDWEAFRPVVSALEQKAGRLIANGFPTGVEVAHAMNHGGPYPATTEARCTSVGSAAIKRFVRPVCFQNLPAKLLPPELRDENPRGILRLIDGQYTRVAV